MTVGGNGIGVLIWGDTRLAYLTLGGREHNRDHALMEFYELYNQLAWERLAMTKGDGDLLTGLQREWVSAAIGLRRISRAPGGGRHERIYDLTHTTITGVDTGEVVRIGEFEMPKLLRVSKSLRNLPSTLKETPG